MLRVNMSKNKYDRRINRQVSLYLKRNLIYFSPEETLIKINKTEFQSVSHSPLILLILTGFL